MIIAGEVLLVDPLGRILNSVGIREMSGDAPSTWAEFIHEFVKRGVRSLFVFFSVWFVLRTFHDQKTSDEMIHPGIKDSDDLIRGLGLGACIQVFSVLLMAMSGWYRITDFAWQTNGIDGVFRSSFHALMYSTETGVIEETVFRWFLITTLYSRVGLSGAVVISSTLFGILHFSGFQTEFPWWASIGSSTIAGLLFAQAYVIRYNVWLPIGIHAGWHAAARVLGSVGVSGDEALFLITEVNGPTLLVNTRYGGAGGFEVAGVFLVSFFLWRFQKKKQIDPKNSLGM